MAMVSGELSFYVLRFLLGVAKLEQLPDSKGVEIAFAGRSNVGKSSLINALTNVNGLARASNTPGRTRELNFFDVNEALTLVDMPGYGYAKAPKHEVKAWQSVLRGYLRGRPGLTRAPRPSPLRWRAPAPRAKRRASPRRTRPRRPRKRKSACARPALLQTRKAPTRPQCRRWPRSRPSPESGVYRPSR